MINQAKFTKVFVQHFEANGGLHDSFFGCKLKKFKFFLVIN